MEPNWIVINCCLAVGVTAGMAFFFGRARERQISKYREEEKALEAEFVEEKAEIARLMSQKMKQEGLSGVIKKIGKDLTPCFFKKKKKL